jgi:membrane protease YdiL (CAAX protease family)
MKIRNPFLVIFWSLGLFFLMHTWQYLGTMIASLVSGATFESIISGNFENQKTIFVMGLLAVIVGIPLVFVIIKYLWKRNFEWMCIDFNLRYFLKGIVWGFILPVGIIFILMISENASLTELPNRFTALNLTAILIGYFGLSLFTAISEEIVFRAIAVREMAAKWNWIVATILGGIYFGVIHLLSNINNITFINAFWIIIAAMIASFLFVAMYVRSKSLWLPIGFHAGWNFCLTAIIGTKMSGKESNFGIFNFELSGNQLLTGGQFGVEASVIPLLFYLVIAILLIKYSKGGKVLLLSNELI